MKKSQSNGSGSGAALLAGRLNAGAQAEGLTSAPTLRTSLQAQWVQRIQAYASRNQARRGAASAP